MATCSPRARWTGSSGRPYRPRRSATLASVERRKEWLDAQSPASAGPLGRHSHVYGLDGWRSFPLWQLPSPSPRQCILRDVSR